MDWGKAVKRKGCGEKLHRLIYCFNRQALAQLRQSHESILQVSVSFSHCKTCNFSAKPSTALIKSRGLTRALELIIHVELTRKYPSKDHEHFPLITFVFLQFKAQNNSKWLSFHKVSVIPISFSTLCMHTHLTEDIARTPVYQIWSYSHSVQW